MKRQILSFLLTLMMVLTLLPCLASATANTADCAENHIYANGICTGCGLPEGLSYKVSGGEATITDYTGSLAELTIPTTINGNTVTVIGQSAFYMCRSLTSVTISDSVTTIGSFAFAHCINLTSVTIPDSVTRIGDLAFNNCSSLESVTIPNSITTIDMGVFDGCRNLTEVNLPSNLTTIGTAAFESCKSLSSITLPNSLTEIGTSAFNLCDSLESITIPSNVTKIGGSAFAGCDALAEIVFTGDAPTFGSDVFRSTTTTAYYPCNNDTWTAKKLQDYDGTITWKIRHGAKTPVTNTAATCTTAGVVDGVLCSVCKEILTAKQVIEPLGHDEVQHKAQTPTCTEIGWSTYVTCRRCQYTTYEELAALGHNYQNGTCTLCGTTSPTSQPTSHNYSPSWSTDVTGHWHQCTHCSNKKDFAAHTPGAAPTETTPQTCTVCGYILNPPLSHEHTYGDWSSNAIYHWHECTGCSEKEDEAAHVAGPEPTKYDPQTCIECGYILHPSLSHEHTYYSTLACNEKGHWYPCSQCNKPKGFAPHDFANNCDTLCDACGYERMAKHVWSETWAGDETGHWYECTVCGEKQTESMSGHDFRRGVCKVCAAEDPDYKPMPEALVLIIGIVLGAGVATLILLVGKKKKKNAA